MCDPVSLGIMLGTKVASSYASNRAADAIDKRRKNIIADTSQLNSGARDIARKSYDQSFNASSPEAMQRATSDATLARTADYQAGIPSATAVVSDNASDAAKRAIVSAITQGTNFSRDLAAKRAAAEGYGASILNRNLVQQRANADIGTQANNVQGNNQVADFQLSQADRAGSKWANIAGLIDAVGSVAGAGYGAMAAPKPVITWSGPLKLPDAGNYYQPGGAPA